MDTPRKCVLNLGRSASLALFTAAIFWTIEASALRQPRYTDDNTKYLQKYVSVQDLWVGWLAEVEDRPNVHIAAGRIVNSGKRTILVKDVRLALLDHKGRVIMEKQILNYPQGTVWQPQIEPDRAVGFTVPIPPSDGMSPSDWTGEVRITVVQIQLP